MKITRPAILAHPRTRTREQVAGDRRWWISGPEADDRCHRTRPLLRTGKAMVKDVLRSRAPLQEEARYRARRGGPQRAILTACGLSVTC